MDVMGWSLELEVAAGRHHRRFALLRGIIFHVFFKS